MSKTYPCTRCNGQGNIPAHSGVLGGICFKCGGTGKQSRRPAIKTPKWAVYARPAFEEEVILVFWIRAKDETAALAKAQRQLADGSGYHPETAYVLSEQEALTRC